LFGRRSYRALANNLKFTLRQIGEQSHGTEVKDINVRINVLLTNLTRFTSLSMVDWMARQQIVEPIQTKVGFTIFKITDLILIKGRIPSKTDK
jgi:hypothetical protein